MRLLLPYSKALSRAGEGLAALNSQAKIIVWIRSVRTGRYRELTLQGCLQHHAARCFEALAIEPAGGICAEEGDQAPNVIGLGYAA